MWSRELNTTRSLYEVNPQSKGQVIKSHALSKGTDTHCRRSTARSSDPDRCRLDSGPCIRIRPDSHPIRIQGPVWSSPLKEIAGVYRIQNSMGSRTLILNWDYVYLFKQNPDGINSFDHFRPSFISSFCILHTFFYQLVLTYPAI